MEFQIEQLQNPNIAIKPSRQPFFSSARNKYIVIGSGLLILVAAIFFFLRNGSFRESGVGLQIEGPSEVAGGELVTYKITYKNDNTVALSDAKLNVLYPTDSIVTKDGNVTRLTTENFEIGAIDSKVSGVKELTAYIVGDRGNIKTIKATLTYRAQKLSSTFQKDASLATTITSLAVPITLVATPTVISGQSTSYLIDYRNQSSQDLDNLRFVVKYPEGFVTGKFTPQPNGHTSGQDFWDIIKLKQGDGSRITVRGTLSGKERETKTVSVILQKKITTPNGDAYVDFEKSEASSVISTPPLSLDLRLNDSNDYVAHLGDTLQYKINFKNNNNSDLSGLSLAVRLEGSMYDFSSVKSDGFFDSRLNVILWNASTAPILNLLPRNQTGSVEFSVRLKGGFSGSMGARDSFIKVGAHLETPNVPAELDLDKLTADDELVTRISTAPTFDQRISLGDPVFDSSGPFPPRVNQKTLFTVRWNLVNPSNDISQTKITATLAPGVAWENQARLNGVQIQPTYNQLRNTVTWDLGTLPGGIGVSFPAYESFFQISITPSVNQVDQTVPLLNNVRFDGVDSFTKEKISRTIFDMGTANLSDTKESGSVQR